MGAGAPVMAWGCGQPVSSPSRVVAHVIEVGVQRDLDRSGAQDRDVAGFAQLEHFPIRWKRLIEKELLQIQIVELVFITKVDTCFGETCSDGLSPPASTVASASYQAALFFSHTCRSLFKLMPLCADKVDISCVTGLAFSSTKTVMRHNSFRRRLWRNPMPFIVEAAQTNPVTWAITGAVITLAILSPVAG